MLLPGGRSKNKMIKTSKSGKQKLEAGQIFYFFLSIQNETFLTFINNNY